MLKKWIVFCFAIILTACGSNLGSAPEPLPTLQASNSTEYVLPISASPEATSTPLRTNTLIPTKTPLPTLMPYSTATPGLHITPANIPTRTPGPWVAYVPGRVYNPSLGCPIDPSDVKKTIWHEEYYYLRTHINLLAALDDAKIHADQEEIQRLWREEKKLINEHARNRHALYLCYDTPAERNGWQTVPAFYYCPNTFLIQMENAWRYYSNKENELILLSQYRKGIKSEQERIAAEIKRLDQEYSGRKNWIIKTYPDVPCTLMTAMYPDIDWQQ